jgi:RNA polymerase sigma-70 factor (ECF subfamily)
MNASAPTHHEAKTMNNCAQDNITHRLSPHLPSLKGLAALPQERELMTDEALVARAQRSDVTALKELLARHEERLFRLTMRFVHDENDAREILQDVFVLAWRKLPGFEGRAQIGSWLYRITANASLMFLRARRRRPTFAFAQDWPEDWADKAANSNHDLGVNRLPRPDEQLALGELQQEIQNAVEKLPDMLRLVFLAREIEGHSTSQAARSLGVSEEAIKTRLHRARAALRENIEGYLAI